MMTTLSAVPVRRSLDRSHHRKPLRVQISRRRTGKPAGAHQFVTQVRFGGGEAVVLPWALRAEAGDPVAHSDPATHLAGAHSAPASGLAGPHSAPATDFAGA